MNAETLFGAPGGGHGAPCSGWQDCSPEGLAAWLGSRRLILLILDRVESLEHGLPAGSPPALNRRDSNRRVTLTLLAYAYTSGVCASEEIEFRCLHDPAFRYLCAGVLPEWQHLRRFRRAYRENLRRLLEAVYREAWELRPWTSDAPMMDAPAGGAFPPPSFPRLAEARLSEAALWDSVASDL